MRTLLLFIALSSTLVACSNLQPPPPTPKTQFVVVTATPEPTATPDPTRPATRTNTPQRPDSPRPTSTPQPTPTPEPFTPEMRMRLTPQATPVPLAPTHPPLPLNFGPLQPDQYFHSNSYEEERRTWLVFCPDLQHKLDYYATLGLSKKESEDRIAHGLIFMSRSGEYRNTNDIQFLEALQLLEAWKHLCSSTPSAPSPTPTHPTATSECTEHSLETPKARALRERAYSIGLALERLHSLQFVAGTEISIEPFLGDSSGTASPNCLKLAIRNSGSLHHVIKHEWAHVAAEQQHPGAAHGPAWRTIADTFEVPTYRYRHCKHNQYHCEPSD